MMPTTNVATAMVATSARSVQHRIVAYRLLLLVPVGVAVLGGLDGGLMLLGLPAPLSPDRLPEVHGMLLVLGFVGAVVSLERAVALRHPVGFLAPALLGLAALLLVCPVPLPAAKTVLLLGCVATVAVYVPLWRRQRDDAVLVQGLAAVLAVGASTMWLGGVPVPDLLSWLVGFVVLTIAGERLELARFAMGTGAASRLVLLSTGLVIGVVSALLWPSVGYPLLGAALLVLAGWLAAHDVAGRTIRSVGLPRFVAACMLAGYCWLGVPGVIWLVGNAAGEGVGYDAVVHATFLGFTVSMIMAHAPVILPAVIHTPLRYGPLLVVPAVLLHLSLVLRLWVGDALGSRVAWQVGGAANVAALLLFMAVVVGSAVAGSARAGPVSAGSLSAGSGAARSAVHSGGGQ
jgi:hypothetical protein